MYRIPLILLIPNLNSVVENSDRILDYEADLK